MNWDTFTLETRKLCELIQDTPDCIIGIARGGVIPAVLIAKRLNVKDLHVLKVKREGNERRVMAEVFTDMTGQKVLLVEDMLETGKSLVVAKKYLESKGAQVQTACLYIMPQTEVKPDYYLKEVLEVQKFPWE